MYLADYHIHSRISPDAETSMKDLAEAGIAAGFDELCFTDHVEPLCWGSDQLRESYDWAALSAEFAAAKAADRLLTIEGVSTSFVLCTIGDEISISARSDGNINVQLVLEALGGGGHFDAAGAQVKDATMREVLERLKASIDAFMSNS